MFPSQLELDVLHTERVREAERQRMRRLVSGPSLFERIRARIITFKAATPQPAPTVAQPPARCDIAVTSS